MSLRQFVLPFITARLLSEKTLNRNRAKAEKKRRAENKPHLIQYFHQVDDPYSHLMLQVLPVLKAKYDVQIQPYLTGPPSKEAAPEYELLKDYARLDAERLASKAGVKFKNPGTNPDDAEVTKAAALLARQVQAGTFVKEAGAVSAALWSGSLPAETPELNPGWSAEGDQLRTRLGHYLGATCFYNGEWYWGLDRLHYLEERLMALCQKKDGGEFIFPLPAVSTHLPSAPPEDRPPIDFFLSFRSPYTYIATERIRQLANVYGVKVNLRFVLPMIMRNLPVPRAKGRYILQDVAREARKHQIDFGRIADPVGQPVRRGYALLPWAISEGRGYEYCLSFMRHAWALGVDTGRDTGMKRVVTEAGLDWQRGRTYLKDTSWEKIAEDNRLELLNKGLWGVPSFVVGSVAVWGQDRLWLVEEALRNPTYRDENLFVAL